ncbi:MAG: septal ring lytic transglycosylase RlpA family protein [Acidobacteria bacterium]|nr:septal ring lytic transglycosylase RlpA family protein [Acidobacteriota bacterium]
MTRRFFALPAALLALAFAACGPKHPNSAKAAPPPEIESPAPAAPPAPAGEAVPASKPLYVEEGIASWYGPYENRHVANGELYDGQALTAAHRTLPLNSMVRVTNLAGGQSAILRITDRGPFITGRILDVSLAAARALGVWRPGTARVRIEVLESPAPIDTGGRWCVQIGAFRSAGEAARLKHEIQERYPAARVLQFAGDTGVWLRVRVTADDKRRAELVAAETLAAEGAVFLVRLD